MFQFPDKQIKIMGTYQDLDIFKLSYRLALRIHRKTKGFPREEIFGMTSQINRSSRSVCVNDVEAYRKKMYPKHFISKLSDADGECSETLIWLKMCHDMNYLTDEEYVELSEGFERSGQMIGKMMQHPEKFNNKS
jgi:four helix bundle protein